MFVGSDYNYLINWSKSLIKVINRFNNNYYNLLTKLLTIMINNS